MHINYSVHMHTSLEYLHVSKLPYIGYLHWLLVNMVGACLDSEFNYKTQTQIYISYQEN